MNYKKTFLIVFLLAIVSIFLGGTLAYYTWSSSEEENTQVVFTASSDFSCSVDGGGNITSSDVMLAPSDCTNSTYAIQRTIKTTATLNTDEVNVSMDLWLDIDNIGTGLSNSQNFRYVLTTEADSCTSGVVGSGTFNGKNSGSNVSLINNKIYSSTFTDTYYLWIWLDSAETSMSTMNQTFSLSLNGSCTNNEKGNPYYVVYSEDDNSLRFYQEDEGVITEGEKYNNLTVTKLYTAYDGDVYSINSSTDKTTTQWDEVRELVTNIVIEDEISPINTVGWFYEFTKTKSIDVSKLNTSNVTNMFVMFGYAGYDSSVTEFTITGLDNWNISKVTDIRSMFYSAGENATTWDIGDLSNWDTSNVTNMKTLFYRAGLYATTWDIGDLSNWDTSNVTNMGHMFNHAAAYSTIFDIGDLSNWDTSKVTTMRSMFYAAGNEVTNFDVGDLGKWDVSNVTDMSFMFYYAGKYSTTFNIGDLGKWDVSNVTDMSSMFRYAGNNATTFNIGNLDNWNVSNVRNMYAMFWYAGTNATTWNIGNLSKWNTSNVTTMELMFHYAGRSAETFDIGELSNWNVSKVTTMSRMFAESGRATAIFNIGNLDNWDVSNVTSMEGMFWYTGISATTFNIGDLSKWNTSSVTNMMQMFGHAGTSASNWSLDLSGWNVNLVTSYTDFNSGVTSKVTPPVWVN